MFGKGSPGAAGGSAGTGGPDGEDNGRGTGRRERRRGRPVGGNLGGGRGRFPRIPGDAPEKVRRTGGERGGEPGWKRGERPGGTASAAGAATSGRGSPGPGRNRSVRRPAGFLPRGGVVPCRRDDLSEIGRRRGPERAGNRAVPFGTGVMGDPGTLGGGSAESGPGEGRGTRLVERLEREIADTGPEAAEAALRALLEGPALTDFLAELTAYRHRAFPATVARVVFVKIRDDLLKERIGHLPIAIRDPGTAAEPAARTIAGRAALSRDRGETGRQPPRTDDRGLPPSAGGGPARTNAPRDRRAPSRVLPGERFPALLQGVKRTSNDEVFLTTFQKIRNSDVRRAERRSRNKDRRRGPDTRGASASASARPGGARWGLPSGRSRQPHLSPCPATDRPRAGESHRRHRCRAGA